MSPMTTQTADLPDCFPRVSGDEPLPRAGFSSEAAFSPRERG